MVCLLHPFMEADAAGGRDRRRAPLPRPGGRRRRQGDWRGQGARRRASPCPPHGPVANGATVTAGWGDKVVAVNRFTPETVVDQGRPDRHVAGRQRLDAPHRQLPAAVQEPRRAATRCSTGVKSGGQVRRRRVALRNLGPPPDGLTDTFSLTFTKAGKYTYLCLLHPGMAGDGRGRRNDRVGRPVGPRRGRGPPAGRGWFMDDLDPLPNIARGGGRALDRGPRPDRVASTSSAALEPCPGVIGVLTRGRRRRAVPAVPVGHRPGGPSTGGGHRPGPLRRRAGGVVVARDRYVAEDAAERVAVDYEPLPVAASPEAALADGAPVAARGVGTQRRLRPHASRTATPTRRSPAPTSCVREPVPPPALGRHAGGGLRRDRRLGRRPPAPSPPGRTSRARSPCTAWRRRRWACPAARLRLVHAGRLRRLASGSRRPCYTYVVLMAIASRRFGVPGALDRGPASSTCWPRRAPRSG